MRVLVAGATGVIGRALVPLLLERGHEVVGLSRSTAAPSTGGVIAVRADALDRDALTAAVRGLEPDVVVNLLTSIPAELRPRRFPEQMAATNRLRAHGTANLLDACPDARPITEGVAFLYDPTGGSPADERRPLWLHGPRPARPVVQALGRAEELTLGRHGTVLRFGHVYGPATHYGADGSFTAMVRAGRVPLAGPGASVFSFVHARDAAAAVALAVESPVTGLLNVVDDDPTPVRHWLPALASLVGGPPPKRVPAVLARLIGGAWGHAYMTSLVGARNDRARDELGWAPRFPSWRDGFEAELRFTLAS